MIYPGSHRGRAMTELRSHLEVLVSLDPRPSSEIYINHCKGILPGTTWDPKEQEDTLLSGEKSKKKMGLSRNSHRHFQNPEQGLSHRSCPGNGDRKHI